MLVLGRKPRGMVGERKVLSEPVSQHVGFICVVRVNAEVAKIPDNPGYIGPCRNALTVPLS